MFPHFGEQDVITVNMNHQNWRERVEFLSCHVMHANIFASVSIFLKKKRDRKKKVCEVAYFPQLK